MNITIARDGQQLGTFTLSEARARVLEGSLLANDWAWYEGASQWTPLNQVPHFAETPPVAGSAGLPQDAPLRGSAARDSNPLSEEELWEGSPSRLLTVPPVGSWALFFLLLAAGAHVGAATLVAADVSTLFGWILLIAVPWCVLSLIASYIALRSTRYLVTNQRVRVIRGVFSKDVQELELFRVKDTSARQSFFLRLFGFGDITIHSGDRTSPVLTLRAVPNAIALREQIRENVMILRQRFGVREMELM